MRVHTHQFSLSLSITHTHRKTRHEKDTESTTSMPPVLARLGSPPAAAAGKGTQQTTTTPHVADGCACQDDALFLPHCVQHRSKMAHCKWRRSNRSFKSEVNTGIASSGCWIGRPHAFQFDFSDCMDHLKSFGFPCRESNLIWVHTIVGTVIVLCYGQT